MLRRSGRAPLRPGPAPPGPLLAGLALAAALQPLAPSPARGAEADGNLRGGIEIVPILYRSEGTPDRAVWGKAHLEWERRLAGRLLLRARGALHLDGRGEVDRGLLYDDDERGAERALLSLEELSLTWGGAGFDIEGGRLAIPWGRTDGFNPTDNISPLDSLDPLRPERLGSWGLRGHAYAGRLTLEGIALLPVPGRQPLAGGRWLPLPERIDNPFHDPNLPATGPRRLPAEFEEGTHRHPAWRLENTAWAVKADYRGTAVEGSVSRYDGWEDQSVYLPRLGAPAGAPLAIPVKLDRVQPDLRVTGADLAWISGPFILRAEAARHERGAPASERLTFLALEGEWSIGGWHVFAIWAEMRGEEPAGSAIVQFEQGALPAAILGVARGDATGFNWSAQVLSNLDGDGSLVRGDVSWPAGRSVRLDAGADLLDGPGGSFLGAFRKNDRIWGRLAWSW